MIFRHTVTDLQIYRLEHALTHSLTQAYNLLLVLFNFLILLFCALILIYNFNIVRIVRIVFIIVLIYIIVLRNTPILIFPFLLLLQCCCCYCCAVSAAYYLCCRVELKWQGVGWSKLNGERKIWNLKDNWYTLHSCIFLVFGNLDHITNPFSCRLI